MSQSHNQYQRVSRLFRIWEGIIQRCKEFSSCTAWKYYGKKGVRVDPIFLGKDGFNNFAAYAWSHGYSDDPDLQMSTERIDPFGSYTPENIKFIPMKFQSQNRRDTKRFEWRGQMLTRPELAALTECAVKYGILCNRIKHGYSMDICMLRPGRLPFCRPGSLSQYYGVCKHSERSKSGGEWWEMRWEDTYQSVHRTELDAAMAFDVMERAKWKNLAICNFPLAD